ncbi:MAG: LPXTG cell wall anchor domain-containing protein [Actinobacteria bacterium]|nr:LPXTG cell wall anchor domain-containing protein [Actinomycetota bacterium]
MIRKMMIGAAALVAVIAAPAAAQYQTTTTTTSTTTSVPTTTSTTSIPTTSCPFENDLVDDAYDGVVNTPITVGAPGILQNDNVCPGFGPEVVDPPTNGAITSFGGDGSFVYQPNDGFTGTDTFTYRVNDEGRKASGKAVSEPATVTLTIADDGGVGGGGQDQGGGGGVGGGGTNLPRTGSNLNGVGLVGAGLLTVGGLLVLSTRKRRREAGTPA